MDEAILHGQPVKAGDRVWTIHEGWTTVKEVDPGSKLFVETPYGWHTEMTVFWQAIDAAAIQAAMLKPKEQEFEWQWLIKSKDGFFDTTGYYPTIEAAKIGKSYSVVYRIEESKRPAEY